MNQLCTPTLTLNSLTCGYGKNVLLETPAEFLLNPGIVQLWGKNASGKSTLLKTLAGRIAPLGGSAYLDTPQDRVTLEGNSWQKHVHYVPEHGGYWPEFTVAENLICCGLCYGLTPQESDTRSRELAQLWELPWQKSYAEQLSSGQQKRLSIAMAMVTSVDVILLDEPFTTLDVHGIALCNALLPFWMQKKRHVLIASHGWPASVPAPQYSLGIVDNRLIIGTGNYHTEGIPGAMPAWL